MNPERPLFAFKLRDVGEIVPWGRPGDLSLSWFGLTDGWYWMNVGHEVLFAAHQAGAGPVYVDYQVVRLWEDVLDSLPAALEPVPAGIAALLEPSSGWRAWQRRANDWAADSGDLDLLDRALGWATSRRLDTLHLVAGPNIWFCRVDEQVRILWDNQERVENGQPVWTATSGRLDLSVGEFLAEVSGFNDRLMNAMSGRVRGIRESWPRPDVRIDVPKLDAEQLNRATWLAHALRRADVHPATDWNSVSEATRTLSQNLL